MHSYTHWTHQKGHIPVTWTKEDYTKIKTIRNYPNRVPHPGASYVKKDWGIYGDLLGSCVQDPNETMPDVFLELCRNFDLKETVCAINSYLPGQVLPFHKDTYRTYAKNKKVTDISKIVRVIMFLHDQIPGQQLWIEDKMYQGKAGFWVAWQGECIHMAANLSDEERYVLQFTGIAE